jgi:DNA-binding transcriptional LysR family regulator
LTPLSQIDKFNAFPSRHRHIQWSTPVNLKQLEVFINVAETGSFSKGAEASLITQSTVSQHIFALENEFGLKLLDRTGKGAMLTEAGKLLLEHARHLVDYAREIPAAIGRFKGLEETKLQIAGSSIPAEYLIPSVLPQLMERFPGMTITLLHGDSREVLNKVLSEEVEIGVVGARFTDEGLDFAPFITDDLILVAPAGHRWAGRVIEKDELASEPFVMREKGSGTGRTAVRALGKAGIDIDSLQVAAYLGSNEGVKRGVMAGVGVSFVSSLSVQKELTQGSLVQVPVQGMLIKREICLATRKGRELSPGAVAFSAVLGELCAEAACC